MNVPGSPSSALHTTYFFGAFADAAARRLDRRDHLAGTHPDHLAQGRSRLVLIEDHHAAPPDVVLHQRTHQRVGVLAIAKLRALEFIERLARAHSGDEFLCEYRRQLRKHLPIDQRRRLLVAHPDARRIKQPHDPIGGNLAEPATRGRLERPGHFRATAEIRDDAVVEIDRELAARLACKEVVEGHRLLHVHLRDAQRLGDVRRRLLGEEPEFGLDINQDIHQPRLVAVVLLDYCRDDFFHAVPRLLTVAVC
ncbi:MAG: hypothetical protein NTY53_16465 [Kiritimatiellaeota bacterium]|nr:hypothetical protein [Kiritimatiellota bacterium]